MKKLTLIPILFIFIMTAVSCKSGNSGTLQLEGLKKTGSMELEYAQMFSVDYYENDLSLITIGKNEQYLVVPENGNVPKNISGSITVIQQPVSDIYLAASSAMDLFDGIGALDRIRVTSTMKKDWALPAVQAAMDSENILYGGKYSAPDYELIAEENCGLAIESTMIYHSPEIREQLEKLGIPVMVERSSYESHPLGRMEWIKLYGLLVGKTNTAEAFFNEKVHTLDSFLDENTNTDSPTAAFFFITSNGYANIHKPGDYVSKMIETAGGKNIFTADNLNVNENDLSTMNVQFETFYAAAKDADILIYNSTIDGGITSVDELIRKNSLFRDFKAVKNVNVWCTDRNMFQQTTGAADMIADMHRIFTNNSENTEFIYRLD